MMLRPFTIGALLLCFLMTCSPFSFLAPKVCLSYKNVFITGWIQRSAQPAAGAQTQGTSSAVPEAVSAEVQTQCETNIRGSHSAGSHIRSRNSCSCGLSQPEARQRGFSGPRRMMLLGIWAFLVPLPEVSRPVGVHAEGSETLPGELRKYTALAPLGRADAQVIFFYQTLIELAPHPALSLFLSLSLLRLP